MSEAWLAEAAALDVFPLEGIVLSPSESSSSPTSSSWSDPPSSAPLAESDESELERLRQTSGHISGDV